MPSSSPVFENLLVVGLGLIGGSFAKAVKEQALVKHILGYDLDPCVGQQAESLGVIDQYLPEVDVPLSEASSYQVDAILLAVPVGATEKTLLALSSWIRAGVVVTDVGSVKRQIVQSWHGLKEHIEGLGNAHLVPGHPIAGSEKRGIQAVNSKLFEQHDVLLTPDKDTSVEALQGVRALWKGIGARVYEMGVEEHDTILSLTSHLPHLLAYSLVDQLASDKDCVDVFRYAAGGFRDFTRIAASDPVMWRDICLTNRTALLHSIDKFQLHLSHLRHGIEVGDGELLSGVFTRAQSARQHFGRLLARRRFVEESSVQKNIQFQAQSSSPLKGQIKVPGDKSISHRSIMFGSIAEGTSHISGFLEGEDALATLQAFRDMGVIIEGPHEGKVVVHGVGLHGLRAPDHELYVGNSGTSIRLLAGLLSSQPFTLSLTGDESLSKRPMRRVTDPLKQMGAAIETAEDGTPPVVIKPSEKGLKGIHYDMPMASAQVKSCVLLAGLYAEGETSVTEPAPTRDHTERMLRGFGYEVETDGATARLKGKGTLKACDIAVPGDISSAAFFLVAASISPGSDLLIKNVGINPTRTGIIQILKLRGADIALESQRQAGGEPIADIRVKYAPLKGIQIPESLVPLAIDEFPVLFIAAACAEGTTILTGAEELRVKESDRIQAMAEGLLVLGVDAQPTPDGIIIKGGPMGGGKVESFDDHRIAMAFSVASLRTTDKVTIDNCANVATSFPNFVELANSVGFNIEIKET